MPGPADLTFDLTSTVVRARASQELDWLAAERRAAFARLQSPAGRGQPAVHDVPRPAPGRAGRASALRATAAAAAPRPGRRSSARPRRCRRAGRVQRGRRRGAGPRPTRPGRPGVILETLGGAGRDRDADLARRLLSGGQALPADDKLAQLTRAVWNQGDRPARPGRRPADEADHPALAGRRAGSRPADPDDRRARCRVPRPRSSRSSRRPSRAAVLAEGAAQALFTGSLELHLGTGSELAVA